MRIRLGQTRLVVAVGLIVLALSASALAQGASNIGTWKLNVAKSKYSPGPAPKSVTLKLEAAAGMAVTTTVDAVAADGTAQHWTFTAAYDGKDVAITGNNPNADTASRKRISATTTETAYKKAGKPTTVNTAVVSADGKTLTITVKGTDAKGAAVNNVQVYDKQ